MSDTLKQAQEAAENWAEGAQSMAEKAQAAAEQAQAAADKAQFAAEWAKKAAETLRQTTELGTDPSASTLADQAGQIAHGLSGGVVDPFVFRFAIFVLAIFIGYYVVWSVTPALHTPLMSVTNAISSVIVVGALLSVAIQAAGFAASFFGFVALVLAAVNIFGGFLVTHRMLAMYKKKAR